MSSSPRPPLHPVVRPGLFPSSTPLAMSSSGHSLCKTTASWEFQLLLEGTCICHTNEAGHFHFQMRDHKPQVGPQCLLAITQHQFSQLTSLIFQPVISQPWLSAQASLLRLPPICPLSLSVDGFLSEFLVNIDAISREIARTPPAPTHPSFSKSTLWLPACN